MPHAKSVERKARIRQPSYAGWRSKTLHSFNAASLVEMDASQNDQGVIPKVLDVYVRTKGGS